jgi:hypothetical protein
MLQAEGLSVNSRGVEERAQRSDDTPGRHRARLATLKGLSNRDQRATTLSGLKQHAPLSGGGVGKPLSPPAMNDNAFGVKTPINPTLRPVKTTSTQRQARRTPEQG